MLGLAEYIELKSERIHIYAATANIVFGCCLGEWIKEKLCSRRSRSLI